MRTRALMVVILSLIFWNSIILAQAPEQRRDANRAAQTTDLKGTLQLGGGAALNSLLLNIPSVQDELKLDETRRETSKRIRDEVAAKSRSFYKPLEKLLEVNSEEWEKRRREFEKVSAIETANAIADLLSPEQFQRFKQINLQHRGATTLGDQDIEDAMGLSGHQKSTIIMLIHNYQSESQTIDYKNSSKEELKLRFEKRKRALHERITKELTAEQQRRWAKILGPPFNF